MTISLFLISNKKLTFSNLKNNPFKKQLPFQDDDFEALKKAKKPDFSFKSSLGQGAFGTVFLATLKKNTQEHNKNNMVHHIQIKMLAWNFRLWATNAEQ